MSTTANDLYLVRTAENMISGPFSKEEVRTKILNGELHLQDEVCPANSYWFYLHEREEVARFLGVEVPKAAHDADDEITETQTRSQPSTEYHLENGPECFGDNGDITTMLPNKNSAGAPLENQLPAADDAHQTLLVRPPASAQMPTQPTTRTQRKARPSVQILGQIERKSVWQGFAWILVTAACLLVYLVLRLLHRAG